MLTRRATLIALLVPLFASIAWCAEPASTPGPKQESESGITHSFVAFGETYFVNGDGKSHGSYPASRDGWVLPNGNLLIAISKNKELPGGAAAEITPDGKTVWQYKGTQSEVNTVQERRRRPVHAHRGRE